jgi:hypothetical protein
MRWILIATLTVALGCVQKHLNEADKPSEVPTNTELEGVWKIACTSGSTGYEQQKYIFSGFNYTYEKVFQATSASCSDGYRLIENGQLSVGSLDSNSNISLNLVPSQFVVTVDSANAASYLSAVAGNMGDAEGACGYAGWVNAEERDVSTADCSNIAFMTTQQSRYDIYHIDGVNLTLGTYSSGHDGTTTATRFVNLSAATFTKL